MKKTLRILNLEDNAGDAELNHEMLSARWPECQLVRVETRAGFQAALNEGGFDLILSDFSMPGFDGRSALALAHEQRPEVPFLFVSGTIGEDMAIEALKNGATDYVLKHRLLRLIPAVDRALREATERSECAQAEAAMRRSEHKYRELFDCLGDAAFLTDDVSGRILDANLCAGTALGCSRAELIGRQQSQFLNLGERRARAGPADPIISAGGMVRSDGITVPVEVRTTEIMLYGHKLILRLCHELVNQPQ